MDPNTIQLNLVLNFDGHIVILAVIVLAFVLTAVAYIFYQTGTTNGYIKRNKEIGK